MYLIMKTRNKALNKDATTTKNKREIIISIILCRLTIVKTLDKSNSVFVS